MYENEGPVYVPLFNDVFRVGTFVHVKLSDQDQHSTTVCQLNKHTDGNVMLKLFYPLFPPKKLKCHPSIPKHDFDPLEEETGSRQIKLYESWDSIHRYEAQAQDISIRYPAFCFTPKQLESPLNRWAEGIKNVYIVRFKQVRENKLVPIDELKFTCFPMDQVKPNEQLIVPPRCFHKNTWHGLFLLRKALIKILNKRGGHAEKRDFQTVTIGNIPSETFNYLHVLLNSHLKCVSCHYIDGSESYQDLDAKLTRRKIRMSCQNGILRFETQEELDIVRNFLGFAAVYGSSEVRPTLKDGTAGVTLKRGHFLTVIRGSKEKPEFKRRCLDQRIDIVFSPFQVKVSVNFERYRYDKSRGGKFKVDPPTDHLESVLLAKPFPFDDKKFRPFPVSADALVAPQVTSPDSSTDPSTADSSDHTEIRYRDTSPRSMAPPNCLVSLGDKYEHEGTTFQVAVYLPPADKKHYVLRDKYDDTIFTMNDPERYDRVGGIEGMEYVGTLLPSKSWSIGCIVVSGVRFKSDVEEGSQDMDFHTDIPLIASLVKANNDAQATN